MLSRIWSAIALSVVRIIEYFMCIKAKKANNTDIDKNEKAKKAKKDADNMNKLINKALKGDKEALDEIRKRIS